MNNAASPRPLLPNRQVHLDFHTSELIPGIGERFDKAQWQAALRLGHVNQINIFAKCHHSWSYYPTEVGRIHPHLEFDLMGAQIEACHEIGVVCPIYVTVGWSAFDAETHPEWCVHNRDGSVHAMGSLDFSAEPDAKRPWGWKDLCSVANGPYHAHIVAQVREICAKYAVDGLFFDIYHDHACYCDTCRQRLEAEGVDLDDAYAVTLSYTLAIRAHMQELRDVIAETHPNATVYFNSATHVDDTVRFRQRLFDLNTQQELEDLPTTWGGYDKLPIEAKFHLGQGSRVLAMSGKFHKAWGEFGGFKHSDAMKYEAAAMIANGAACNFGDHMHPCGELDVETYRLLGEAFQYVEQIEAYGPGGIPFSRLGLWLTLDRPADYGTANILLELQQDFVIANEGNLDELEALILPSRPSLTEAQAAQISGWVERGGKLIVFGAGGLSADRSRFLIDVGAEVIGPSEYHFDYTVVKPEIGEGLVSTPFLNYESGLRTRLTSGEALAAIRDPYFNRTYAHYSGHQNTPFQLEDSPYPAIVRQGNIIFFAHALDRLYYTHAVRLHRDVVQNALNMVGYEPAVSVAGLPSSGRLLVLHQPAEQRYVAHLLYSPALQRGEVKVIEDFPTIDAARLKIRLRETITKAFVVPGGSALAPDEDIAVPPFRMHTAIVLGY
jgi:hypothetical protein